MAIISRGAQSAELNGVPGIRKVIRDESALKLGHRPDECRARLPRLTLLAGYGRPRVIMVHCPFRLNLCTVIHVQTDRKSSPKVRGVLGRRTLLPTTLLQVCIKITGRISVSSTQSPLPSGSFQLVSWLLRGSPRDQSVISVATNGKSSKQGTQKAVSRVGWSTTSPLPPDHSCLVGQMAYDRGAPVSPMLQDIINGLQLVLPKSRDVLQCNRQLRRMGGNLVVLCTMGLCVYAVDTFHVRSRVVPVEQSYNHRRGRAPLTTSRAPLIGLVQPP